LTQLLEAGVLESKRGYTPEEFKFLLNTFHIDPENGLPYKIVSIGVHKKKLVTVQRQLINIQSGQTLQQTDVVHALDACLFYLLSNPKAPCPLIDPGSNSARELSQWFARIAEIKKSSTQRARGSGKRKKSSENITDTPLDSVPAHADARHDANFAARRSKRLRELTKKVFQINLRTDRIEEIEIDKVPIPNSHPEAMRSTFAKFWADAEQCERKGLLEKGCYDIVDLPAGEKIIKFKWVYAVKGSSKGHVVRFKARLTARGDLVDVEDLDFDDVFSPVVSWEGVRTYLALTVLLGLIPLQLDVDLAYLYADLEQPVYMEAPEGFGLPRGKVLKLKKSLYGLPQSGRNWYNLISGIFSDNTFKLTQLVHDSCLYIKSTIDGSIILLCLYVDDIYVATSTMELQEEIVNKLQQIFKLKVLGVPDQLLGLTLSWGEHFRSVHIHAGKTIRKLMRELDIYSNDGVVVPMNPNLKLSKLDCPTKEEIAASDRKQWKIFLKKYQKICGSGIFCMNVCRPDIAFAINVLTRQMHNPGETYMDAAIELVKYLAGTVELGILFRATGNRRPLVYCDSDRGSDESRKPTSGHVLFLAGGPLVWKSLLVDAYALSTCEAEIRAIDAARPAVVSALFIQHLLEEILSHLPSTDIDPRDIPLRMSTNYDSLLHINLIDKHEPFTNTEKANLVILEDNKATIEWAKKPGSGSKMKHLEIDLHWIKRAVRDHVVMLQYVPTKEQLADVFTKALAHTLFIALISQFMFYHVV